MGLGKKKKESAKYFALALVSDAYNIFECGNGSGVAVDRHGTYNTRRSC